ncbi:MAG: hypothetical protein B7O98_07910 [Zestosphaera tikiterensis]|uniref:DUF211 domain-containing protein n=1 Tax=Zestosphaera tikiterensis TaxID=1973259 RepID=A0A2R7Y1L5_9CREN|nr:MAG: hypothetical protein B7O98_09375 [Zestosphaera tikiterensis]PUA32561.1 MAG: hypothetical protein B7O98_07910 [Zestosphaera tikiterensis]
MGLKKVVLDVLKPIKGYSLVTLAQNLTKVDGVKRVSVVVNEIDVETVTLNVTVEGDDIDFDGLRSSLEGMGAVIHSVDEVIVESEEISSSEEEG